MKRPSTVIVAAVSLLGLSACSGAARSPMQASPNPRSPAAQAAADSGRQPFSEADVHFASGMIGHHAQAIVMAGWCPSHGAGASLQVLCERIVVAQRDEIAIMQNWLRDNRQPVPEADARGVMMPGMDHHMVMPGMLTPEQMAQLDRARGPEFDRLFLTFMIQHHQGAITMVDALLESNNSANDVLIYKIASDVYADQTTEIERMTRMLAALPSGGR